MSSDLHNGKRCPLCGGENKCSVGSGDCWCFHTKVPQALWDHIPAALKGQACICRKCVEAYPINKTT